MPRVNEIAPHNLRKGQTLGRGYFGTAYKGTWTRGRGKIDVALKVLHDDYNNMDDEFYREAGVMASLDHHHIIKLHGICSDPLIMVLELASGSALEYVQNYSTNTQTRLTWSAQIAEGMNYLENKGFVHRDLALRNVLLDFDNDVKISDFGMTRAVGSYHGNSYYYTMSPGGAFPCKWCAPESLQERLFTSKSDVWSYGVTIWEIFSEGEDPYGRITVDALVRFLSLNKRLKKPDGCPVKVYQNMLKCWKFEPYRRPSFESLRNEFYQMARQQNRRHQAREDDGNTAGTVAAVVGGIALGGLALLAGLAAANNN